MKITLPIVVLTIAVLGCGRFGAGSNAGTNNGAKSNSTSAAAVKAVDMPSLVGKSPEEVKKIVGIEPRFETPYLAFELPQGTLTVDYMKGRQTTIGFELKAIQVGSQTATGFDSPDKLGDLVGIDLHGVPVPTPTGGFYFYDNVKASGGTPLKRVSLHKTTDSFNQISIDLDSL